MRHHESPEDDGHRHPGQPSRCGCSMALAIASLLLGLTVQAAPAETVNFDASEPGQVPVGWTATKTGQGTPHWAVALDDSAPSKPKVLKQSGTAAFPLCIKDSPRIKDGFVEVKFEPVAGKEDEAGGIVWRLTDANNYYVARANALEDNVTIYRTVGGERLSFKNVDAKVAPSQWHTLRVDFVGNIFTVSLDGKEVLTASDSTFPAAGNIGLWTKSDSLTLFDDFTFEAHDAGP